MVVGGGHGADAFLCDHFVDYDILDLILFACPPLRPLFICLISVFSLYRGSLVFSEPISNFDIDIGCATKS